MYDLNNIEIPDNIDLLTTNAINKGEKHKNNKAICRKLLFTALTICFVITFGMTSYHASAEIRTFTENVFNEIKDIVGIRGNDEGSDVINKTVTDNGISITLQDVLCDEYGVYVSFIVKSNKSFIDTDDSQLMLYDNYATTNFHKGKLDNGGVAGLEGKFIDKNTFVGEETYLFRDVKSNVPDNFTLDINIGAVSLNSINDDGIIRGRWKFSVPVVLNGNGVKIITSSIEQGNISIKKVSLSTLNTFIEAEVPANLVNEQITLKTDKGVIIDRILYTTSDSNGKLIMIQQFKGTPDDTNSLILNFGDNESITIDINSDIK